MKKTLSILLALMLVALSFGAMAEEKIILGATGLQEDQFTQVMINGYKDAAAELGIEIITANSNHSAEKETEAINNMLQAGAKGIIIEPTNPDTSAAIADTAFESGAAVMACAIVLHSDNVFASCLNDCYDLGLSTGAYARGYFEEHFDKEQEIKMAIVCFDAQDAYGSAGRVDGFLDSLADFNINVVARADGEAADKAYNVTTDIMTANPDIDVFYFACENACTGGVNAIEAAGNPNGAVAFAIDCSEVMVDMMKSDANILQGTSAQDPYGLGTYAVKTTYNYLVNGIEPEVKEYHAPCTLLTKSDLGAVDEWLTTWNEYANR